MNVTFLRLPIPIFYLLAVTSDMSSKIINIAKAWAKYDPNEKTSSYVQNLIEDTSSTSPPTASVALKVLESLFPTDGSRIGFGTAGLRSAMKPGPLGMNDLVIIQATQGLAKYCLHVAALSKEEKKTNDNDKKLIAIIGYDHRSNDELNLSSKSFALLTKLVFLQAGFECILLDGFVATPLVAYATIKYKAAVGIMITASHNPKVDAGTIAIGPMNLFYSIHT